MSGKPLKLKDLIPINFTLANKHSSVALEAREVHQRTFHDRHMPARSSHRLLDRNDTFVVLRTSPSTMLYLAVFCEKLEW